MPFAKKFRAMMDFPFPGDRLGEFTVETVDVWDEQGNGEGHVYGVRLRLSGPGGVQALRKALRPLLSRHPITFSGYGNPYQLWFMKPEIESLGEQRYQVNVKGGGVRIYLGTELQRFLHYLLTDQGVELPLDREGKAILIADYLKRYHSEIQRQVGGYTRKVEKTEKS